MEHKMILSASGWRKVFAESGIESDTTAKIGSDNKALSFLAAQSFLEWLQARAAKLNGGKPKKAAPKTPKIVVATDTRPTGKEIAECVLRATGVEATDANIRAKLGLVRGTGMKVLYANAYTIWNILAGINDGAGNKAFIPSPQADPVTKGVVYGYTVKEDNNLSDKVIYAGAPGLILANNFEELFINHAMDPKTFEDIVAGYSLFDAGLENPLGFVKVTFQ